MLVSRLGEQEMCGGHRDKIVGIKKRELQRFIELGDNLQMNSRNGNKCEDVQCGDRHPFECKKFRYFAFFTFFKREESKVTLFY